MIYDQATELRRLVLAEGARSLAPEAPAPPLIVILGSRRGVGATTVAVHLAQALVRQGRRTVLVDGNLQQPDLAAHCGLANPQALPDVLGRRRTVHELLQPGPAGIQVLPGTWGPSQGVSCSSADQQRLLAELARLGAHTDLVLLEAGGGLNPVSQRFAQAADLVLVVTDGEPSSVAASEATIRALDTAESIPPILNVVNRAASRAVAEQVHTQIARACRRVLGAATVVDAASVGDRAPTANLDTLAQQVLGTLGGRAGRRVAG